MYSLHIYFINNKINEIMHLGMKKREVSNASRRRKKRERIHTYIYICIYIIYTHTDRQRQTETDRKHILYI